MEEIMKKSKYIALRKSKVEDLEFIIRAERDKDNSQYVGQWTKEQHINALENKDILHIIVEDANTTKPIGYIIISGLENLNKSIEFKRFVICEKGKGIGKETLDLVKDLVFNDLNAHRLWLDVRLKNKRAQNVYKSQGFNEEGILRECIFYNGEYESLIVMSIIENEYIFNK
ncbi:MAG: GNAT family protein [Romboutsia sp.]